jgi:hypothetical protein
MRYYSNLNGKRIGWLEVLELEKQPNIKKKLWKCKCICGNIVYKSSSKLNEAEKDGYNISCGCSKKQEDLIGKVFNDYKIIQYIKKLPKLNRLWKCKCLKCNDEFELSTYQLKKNLNICKVAIRENKEIRKQLHTCFSRIKRRCYNSKSHNFKYYGGRGIKICDEWLSNSDNFVSWALENGYKCNLSIDRIDNNGNYEPSNCRWTEKDIQANNKSNNLFYLYNGKTQTLAQWCKELDLNYKYVHYLINKKKKPFEIAIKYRKRG